MLDNLPTWLRDLIIAVAPILLGVASHDLVPYLQGRSPAIAGLVGVLVTVLATYFTPVTRAYGVGKPRA